MSSGTNPSLALPTSFRIKIEAYDQAEKDLLERLPQWNRIKPYITAGEITVQKQTFLKYSMFRQRDIYTPEQITRLVSSREMMLSNLIICNDEFIGINPACDVTGHRSEAEDLGEALGLCVADAMFGTTDLDWHRIGEDNTTKTLDTTANTHDLKIEWESKGSIVLKQVVRPSTVSKHKLSIKRKKGPSTSSTEAVRLGSIAVLRKSEGLPSNIYLVDPPVSYNERGPEQLRTLNRMQNVADFISTLKPRSQIAAGLRSRILALVSLTDFSELDQVELRNGVGEPFAVGPGDDGTHSMFFTSRSRVNDENVGGHAVFIDQDWLFFYGMHGQLVEFAATQQFKDISNYEVQNVSVQRTVTCVFTETAFKRITGRTSKEAGENVSSDGQYAWFSARGELNYTAGGFVFGWLERPADI